MKIQHVVPIVVLALTLGLFGVVWPMTWRSGKALRLGPVHGAAKLRTDLGEIESAMTRYVQEMGALAKAMHGRRAGNVLAAADAFGRAPTPTAVAAAAQPGVTGAEALAQVQAATAEAVKARLEEPGKDDWGDLKLLGVVFAGKDSVVIINWGVYKLGSIVEGMKIVEIREKEVVLASKLGQRRVLMLKEWELEGKNP